MLTLPQVGEQIPGTNVTLVDTSSNPSYTPPSTMRMPYDEYLFLFSAKSSYYQPSMEGEDVTLYFYLLHNHRVGVDPDLGFVGEDFAVIYRPQKDNEHYPTEGMNVCFSFKYEICVDIRRTTDGGSTDQLLYFDNNSTDTTDWINIINNELTDIELNRYCNLFRTTTREFFRSYWSSLIGIIYAGGYDYFGRNDGATNNVRNDRPKIFITEEDFKCAMLEYDNSFDKVAFTGEYEDIHGYENIVSSTYASPNETLAMVDQMINGRN